MASIDSSTGVTAPPLLRRPSARAASPIPSPEHALLRYLAPSDYSAWDALARISPQGSVFCYSWYLQALGGENGVLGYFEGGRLVAGIPLHFERRLGARVCCMPKLTPGWGVVIQPLAGKPSTVAARTADILSVFAARLSTERIFIQSFHPTIGNWLPFRWRGFRETSRFTYILEDLSDETRLWNGMAESCRRQIRKATKEGLEIRLCEWDVVFQMAQKTFARQNMKVPYREREFKALCCAAAEHAAGQCFAAQDGTGCVHAAALLVWDTKRAYYLAGGGDPLRRMSGAMSLLLWHMIQYSAQHSAIFDFEGSDIQAIERFFRSFGAKQEPYHYIMKYPRWMAASLALAGKI